MYRKTNTLSVFTSPWGTEGMAVAVAYKGTQDSRGRWGIDRVQGAEGS